MAKLGNLLLEIPEATGQEWFETILKGSEFRMERIVSRGQTSPEGYWYQQVEAEWVVVLQGRARVMFEEGEVHEMAAGSHLLIPAETRHRVDWTDPHCATIWLAIHFQAKAGAMG